MERLSQLIGKLNEQFEQNADLSQLLLTTQLIEAELMRLSSATRQTLGTSKVAVMMPANGRAYGQVTTLHIAEEVEEPEEKAIEQVLEPVAKNGSYNGNNG